MHRTMTRKPQPKPKPLRAWPTVPKLCPGGTVVILAGGPSLTRADVEYVRDKADAVIAINNTFKLAPWATILFASDRRWWVWHKGAPKFAGRKYTLSITAGKMFQDVLVLRNSGREGLDADPSALKHGYNGAHMSINLAVHLGAKRIILLGVDMQRGPKGEEHWHGHHPNMARSNFKAFIRTMQTTVNPLNDLGIEVINCSPRSALECFPKMPLREALPERLGVAC